MKKINKNTLNSIDKATLFIAIISIAVVPLLIRIVLRENPLNQYSWFLGDDHYLDAYSFFKAQTITILGLISFALLAFRQFKFKTLKLKDPIVFLTLVLAVFTILSLFFSINRSISSVGYIERYENTWVWLSYLFIFLLVYGMNWNQALFRKLIFFFVISCFTLSTIGILQYLGFDPVFNNITKFFLTDSSMNGVSYETSYLIDYKVIVQTLYHYNYVGYYLSLGIPVILSLVLYEKRLNVRLLYLLLLSMMLFNLLGSSARGGLFGVVFILPFFVLFNRHIIFKNMKQLSIIILLLLIIAIGFEIYTDGFMTQRIKSIFTSVRSENILRDINVNDDHVAININNSELLIYLNGSPIDSGTLKYFVDGKDSSPIISSDHTFYYFSNPSLAGVQVTNAILNNMPLLQLRTYDQLWHFGYVDDKLVYVNDYGKADKIETPKHYGFEGKEKLGSSRGYIWSRTIPLIIEKPFFGYGVETFALAFPQDDYVGKFNAYSTTNMVVDKAHNLFLQIAINSGIVALFSFLLIYFIAVGKIGCTLIKNSFVIDHYVTSCLFFSMISYFIASFFNDSTVHVSPVFWVFIAITANLSKNPMQFNNAK